MLKAGDRGGWAPNRKATRVMHECLFARAFTFTFWLLQSKYLCSNRKWRHFDNKKFDKILVGITLIAGLLFPLTTHLACIVEQSHYNLLWTRPKISCLSIINIRQRKQKKFPESVFSFHLKHTQYQNGINNTDIKVSQLVASLETTEPSTNCLHDLYQVVYKFGTSAVSNLLQGWPTRLLQSWHTVTILLQPSVVNLVAILLHHDFYQTC